MNNITSTIKQLRKKSGLSQKNMAEGLHIGRSTYSKLESGNTALYFERLINISKVLGVPIHEIIKENGDPIFKSIKDELSLMFLMTYYELSEKFFKMIPFQKLKPIHKKLLKENNFFTQEAYEDTPKGGRIYDFGPNELFRYMIEICGMDVLFRRKMIIYNSLNDKWKKYQKEKGKTNNLDKKEIQIDTIDYFLVYLINLKLPGNNEKTVQFAERDSLNGKNEFDILEYLKIKTGALDAEIICYTDEGYAPFIEIIK